MIGEKFTQKQQITQKSGKFECVEKISLSGRTLDENDVVLILKKNVRFSNEIFKYDGSLRNVIVLQMK